MEVGKGKDEEVEVKDIDLVIVFFLKFIRRKWKYWDFMVMIVVVFDEFFIWFIILLVVDDVIWLEFSVLFLIKG